MAVATQAFEKKRIKKVLYLTFSIFLILIFIFVIAPLLDRVPIIKPIIQTIEDQNINASALYYTELEESSKAEMIIRNALNFSPQKPK